MFISTRNWVARIKTYNIIDLFAGAGGLSLGFRQTGRVNIVAAAELNTHARKTYKRNFKVKHFYSDVCAIDYVQLKEGVGAIDILIGGPPCQGFSNANRQRTSLINQNNRLVKEYIRAIRALHPTVFVMENVAALRSETHRFLVDETDFYDTCIMKMPLKEETLDLLSANASFDGALAWIRDIETDDAHVFPEALYKELSTLYRFRKHREKFDIVLTKHTMSLRPQLIGCMEIGADDEHSLLHEKNAACAAALLAYIEKELDFTDMIGKLRSAFLLQRAIRRKKELADHRIRIFGYREERGAIVAVVRTYAVLDYIRTMLGDAPHRYILSENTLNALHYGAPQKRERFILVGFLSDRCATEYTPPSVRYTEGGYRTVRDAIGDLQEYDPSVAVDAPPIPIPPPSSISELGRALRGTRLCNHVITATTDVVLERFHALKEGQNFHDLDPTLKTTYTNTARTQNTIYMRLRYDEPCGTVVNVRKSMWIHPTLDRAISIREAARLQTFPDAFIFEGTKDAQYQQVGNAVPPFLAKAIAESIISILDRNTRI